MTMFASDVFDKGFASRIATMIHSRLIWYRHYYLWTDELIAELSNPPSWILEIATIKYYPDAVKAINRFVGSSEFALKTLEDEFIACLFLRYRAGAISWETFLLESGTHADCAGGRNECEYFYCMSNKLEDAEYNQSVEELQVQKVCKEYDAEIAAINGIYPIFLDYFRRYVREHPSN